MQSCSWLSIFSSAAILLITVSNPVRAGEPSNGSQLASALVGTWQSPVVKTDWGPLGAAWMFGKNGVLVVTGFNDHIPKWKTGFTAGYHYEIVGDQLVCKGLCDFEKSTIRITGDKLELKSDHETEHFTREAKEDSVVIVIHNLVADMKAPDCETRANAVQGICHIGPEAREGVPVLRRMLNDRDPNSWPYALEALVNIDPLDKSILPAITKRLTDRGDPVLAGQAAQEAGKLGPAAKEAVPALIEMLKTGEENNQFSNQFHAAEALGNIGTDAHTAIPALKEWAKNYAQNAQRAAAPDRKELARGGEEGARRTAVEAIRKIELSTERKSRSSAAAR